VSSSSLTGDDPVAIINTSTTADSSRGWLISICARDDDITASRKRWWRYWRLRLTLAHCWQPSCRVHCCRNCAASAAGNSMIWDHADWCSKTMQLRSTLLSAKCVQSDGGKQTKLTSFSSVIDIVLLILLLLLLLLLLLQPFYGPFWDHPGEPVPEENFWTLWCKERLTEADTPTIRLGATPSGLTSAHLHHPHFLQARCPSCLQPTASKHWRHCSSDIVLLIVNSYKIYVLYYDNDDDAILSQQCVHYDGPIKNNTSYT